MKWMAGATVVVALVAGVVAMACGGGDADDGDAEDAATGTTAAVAEPSPATAHPAESPTAGSAPLTGSYRYNVTYSTISETCEEEILDTFDGTMDIRIGEGTIDIHGEPGSTDSAGTIAPDGVFEASGSGDNYSETWEGRLEDGRIEAVNDHEASGCTTKFSVTGESETQE